MVNRFFFVIVLLTFSNFIFANNICKKIDINNGSLEVYFKKSLKKHDIKASIDKKKKKYIFDFKNCILGKDVKSIKSISGDIKSIRIAQYKSKVVRLVIDSKKLYKLKYLQKDSPILHISLPKNIKITKKIEPKKSKSISSPKDLFNFVEDDVDNKNGIKKSSLNLKYNYTIMVDAGHGGKDSGTSWIGIKEKDVVLSVAKKVYQKLKTLGFKVKMTRYKDYYITLRGRIKKANKANADLFVSIHANAVSNKNRLNKAYGIETYFLQNTRNARARRVAAKENAQMLKEMDRTTQEVLLNTVFTGPKILLSNRLAIDVQKNILASLKHRYKNIKDNGVRGGPFYVLVGAEMPAILVEIGYLSNPMERKRLLNKKYQDRLANGIVKGIISYLKNREKELE